MVVLAEWFGLCEGPPALMSHLRDNPSLEASILNFRDYAFVSELRAKLFTKLNP